MTFKNRTDLLSVHPPHRTIQLVLTTDQMRTDQNNIFSSLCILFILTDTFLWSCRLPFLCDSRWLRYCMNEYEYFTRRAVKQENATSNTVIHQPGPPSPECNPAVSVAVYYTLITFPLNTGIDVATQYQWLCKYNYACCGKNLRVCACTHVVKVIVALIQEAVPLLHRCGVWVQWLTFSTSSIPEV